MNYVTWALIGMVGYSLTTLLMKLAIRGGQFSSFLVLACATVIVCSSAWCAVLLRGDLQRVSARDFVSSSGWLSYATGVALAVAVMSLFRALSLGPASIVVPVYGMFIVGGAILGIVFLHEPLTARKLLGIGLAVVSVLLIAKG
ncbi:MAG TPA: EamA family transporter [Chthoniobacterales bacterium]|jgi:transporter family protein